MALSFGRALMGAHAAGESQRLQKEQDAWLTKQEDLQRKATKKAQGKSLWSSLGGKMGALAGSALGTGALTLALSGIVGPAAPALAAAISGGLGSFAGRKLGEQGYGAQGKGTLTKGGYGLSAGDVKKMQLSGGKFHGGSRAGLESAMGRDVTGIKEGMSVSDRALHQQQIMASLTDAATAGAVKGGGDWMGDLFGGAEVAADPSDIVAQYMGK